MTMGPSKVLIMGAAGRDFHNFNVVFRDNSHYRVVAFTAAQIPNIAGRHYPPELAGRLYPEGIPIHPESDVAALITRYGINQVVFAYSDVSHDEVMRKASLVMACGADFRLLGPSATMLTASKPVVSVCAVRTGCGKSPVARKIAAVLRGEGLRVAVVRHPMPYGDLAKQAVQRFQTLEDLRQADCTIEEREEYEPHVAAGQVVYAGVDYEKVLHQAEEEADVLVWDGGNNDWPFFFPDVEIVLVDPHRAGHESRYFPGAVNIRRAKVLVLTKLDTAEAGQVAILEESIQRLNPGAMVIRTAMPIAVEEPERIRNRRVLVVEDGPTLTHGGMALGAGTLAARQFGARELVDPRPHAVGSLKEALAAYPHLGPALPAMGYGREQMRELEETIRRVPCDLVLIATPVDLRHLIRIDQPACRVTYEVEEMGRPTFGDALQRVILRAKPYAETS